MAAAARRLARAALLPAQGSDGCFRYLPTMLLPERGARRASTSSAPTPRSGTSSARPTVADTVEGLSLFATAKQSRDLAPKDEGRYYPVQEQVIPEAFQQWYTNRESKAGKSVQAEGGAPAKPLPTFVAGCGGLQHEFAQSYYPYLMYRSAFSPLWNLLKNAKSVCEQRVLVRGAPGCGKSVMLAATAEHLRQCGWIVLYVPDCRDITMKNNFYSRNAQTGMYDTRDAAQNILRATAEAHSRQLAELPQRVEGGSGSLLDLCTLPESASDATLCNAVVRLKLELYQLPAGTRSAVVLDNYNALHWKTEMAEVQSVKDKLRQLDAQELTLGANLRVLTDAAVGHTAVVAATSVSGDIPELPLGVGHDSGVELSKFTLPLLSAGELGTMLQYYRFVHALAPSQAITEKGVEAAHQLTAGDGKAVRRNLHFLLPYDPALDDMDTIGELYSKVSLNPA